MQKELGTAGTTDLLLRQPALKQYAMSMGYRESPPVLEQWQFALYPKTQIVRNWRSYSDELRAYLAKPYYQRSAAPPPPRDPIHRLLFDLGIEWAESAIWEQRDALWRIARARLAIRRYELRHGRPPATLKELIPTYLPAVPQDPFAPKPLVYQVKGKTARIYSRGPDGDDDGGRNTSDSYLTAKSEGDVAHSDFR